MHRKAILLASVATVALVVAQPAFADGPYFSVSGGAVFVKDTDGTFSEFFRGKNTFGARFDPDGGFLISTAIGLELDRWLAGLRLEAEASYRRNHVAGLWTRTEEGEVVLSALSSGPIDAHMTTFALMANAWYEFNIGSRFRPYFGGGVGWAQSEINGVFVNEGPIGLTAAAINPFEGFNVQNSGFAYQLGVGVTSQVMPGVSLGLGYRMFNAPDTEIFFQGKFIGDAVGPAAANESNSINFSNISHSVALTLTVDVY